MRYACVWCCDTGCVVDPGVDPASVMTEGDLLMNCPACTPPPLDKAQGVTIVVAPAQQWRPSDDFDPPNRGTADTE